MRMTRGKGISVDGDRTVLSGSASWISASPVTTIVTARCHVTEVRMVPQALSTRMPTMMLTSVVIVRAYSNCSTHDAPVTGLEPAISALTGRRPLQLDHTGIG